MTTLVNDETAHLALVSLFAEPPDEVLAVATERRVLEEPRDELVVLDLADVLLLERALAHAGLQRGAAAVADGVTAFGLGIVLGHGFAVPAVRTEEEVHSCLSSAAVSIILHVIGTLSPSPSLFSQ